MTEKTMRRQPFSRNRVMKAYVEVDDEGDDDDDDDDSWFKN
jgi:hypothetical protein